VSRTPYYQSDNPTKVAWGVGWRSVAAVVLAIVVVGIIGAGTWAVKVATSDTRGRGDATQIKNDARNRINAQTNFEQLYADIKASDAKIDVLDAAAKADPTVENRTNATGIRTYCLAVVGQYNADARSYASADFRAADLPDQIDTTDPATDCKGSNQR
jgi:hypothetical protein